MNKAAIQCMLPVLMDEAGDLKNLWDRNGCSPQAAQEGYRKGRSTEHLTTCLIVSERLLG